MKTQEADGCGECLWQQRVHAILFKTDTRAGRAFDMALLSAILLSVLMVMLESVESIRSDRSRLFGYAEWTFTLLFTAEYVLRLVCVKNPRRYALSFFGLVDLLAVLPTYIGLLVVPSHYFLVVRVLRMVRVFRILKLNRYIVAGQTIWTALKAARPKISVFLMAVLSIVVVVGTLMYLLEGPESGFTSIPISIYWAIVTLTTVGYGDIAPATVAGQMLASLLMITGYSIIAVPTGIVTVEWDRALRSKDEATTTCPACGLNRHAADARFCKACGKELARARCAPASAD